MNAAFMLSSDVNVAFTPYDQDGDGSRGASLVT